MIKVVPLCCLLLMCLALALVSCVAEEEPAPTDADDGNKKETTTTGQEVDSSVTSEDPTALITQARDPYHSDLDGIVEFFLEFRILGLGAPDTPSYCVGYIHKQVCVHDVDLYLRSSSGLRWAGGHGSDGRGGGGSLYWRIEPNIGKQLSVTVTVKDTRFAKEGGYEVTAVVPTDVSSIVYIGGGDLILRSVPRK